MDFELKRSWLWKKVPSSGVVNLNIFKILFMVYQSLKYGSKNKGIEKLEFTVLLMKHGGKCVAYCCYLLSHRKQPMNIAELFVEKNSINILSTP